MRPPVCLQEILQDFSVQILCGTFTLQIFSIIPHTICLPERSTPCHHILKKYQLKAAARQSASTPQGIPHTSWTLSQTLVLLAALRPVCEPLPKPCDNKTHHKVGDQPLLSVLQWYWGPEVTVGIGQATRAVGTIWLPI